MNLEELSSLFYDLIQSEKTLFLKFEPVVLDFTQDKPFRMIICSKSSNISFEVKKNELRGLLGLLTATILNHEVVDIIYAWNIKALFSYAKHTLGRIYVPNVKIFDLQIIERYHGLDKDPPKDFRECVLRFKEILNMKNSWKDIYSKVHLPMIIECLPEIETTPLLDKQRRSRVYPYYEIEGQTNGRLNSLGGYKSGYIAHTMSPDLKMQLVVPGEKKRFVTADFKHCEVTVIQRLSGDQALYNLIESGKDLHCGIYEDITGDECNSQTKRNISKMVFLPFMYGCGSSTLSKLTRLPVSVCDDLILRIKHKYKTSYDWIMSKQEEAQKGTVYDFFGRPRNFPSDKSYLARNFCVQAPSATVNLEHLISLVRNLTDGINVCFSIHDGFGLYCDIEKAKDTFNLLKNNLEKESELIPGLRMKIEVQFGTSLLEMKTLWR